jgi:hypothetical protein
VVDNNGTLWCEKPMPIQLDFILRRLAEMMAAQSELAGQHPNPPILRLLLLHDDAEREFDYRVGAEQALSQAEADRVDRREHRE